MERQQTDMCLWQAAPDKAPGGSAEEAALALPPFAPFTGRGQTEAPQQELQEEAKQEQELTCYSKQRSPTASFHALHWWNPFALSTVEISGFREFAMTVQRAQTEHQLWFKSEDLLSLVQKAKRDLTPA